jgi:DNA uptake protein ComE-like DNA-binding protein
MIRRRFLPVRAAATPLLLAALVASLAACAAKERDPGVDDTAQADPGAASVPGIPPGAPTTAGAASDSATMANAPAAGGTDAAATGAGPDAATGALLDPNTATREQLAAVPGMTAAAADALIAGRPYQSMTAVDAALAKAQLDSTARRTVYGRVFRPIDLNTATGSEILLIPGVGPRLRHEFEEYRPYRNVERFRREIGKYVDQAEVARLERYVSIR